jgi:Tfp pilus assembly protein PilO
MMGQFNSGMGRWMSRLGLPGIIGIGLLVMCVALYFSLIQPKQLQLQEARQSADLLSDKMNRMSKASKNGDRPAAEQLTEFYQIFPDEKSSVDLIGKIAVIAQNDGFNLDEGEYKVNHEKIGHLTRMQIILPVKAQYQQIRKFLADISSDIPVVSLEQIQFQRQKVGDPLVDTHIKLALYLGQSL